MRNLSGLRNHVLEGKAREAETSVRRALSDGLAPHRILDEGLVLAMTEVGNRFGSGEIFVPEMLVAARAMKAGLEQLRSSLTDAGVQARGKVVLGTVAGDLHDLGKNLVAMMLEGAGFEVIDLGVDVSPRQFVDEVVGHRADFVGFSALLTTTMPMMETNIRLLEEAGLRKQVTVMVGGAPVTSEFARKIGADIYAADASSAATLARQAVSQRQAG